MKILFAGLKYDYGIQARGPSLESKTIIPAIQGESKDTDVFWLEENGFPNNTDQLQINLIHYAEKTNPDVIFFLLMKDEILPETLKYLNERYITTNWFCDDTWRFEDFSSTIAPLLSVSITNDKFSLKKYEKMGCKAILTQWGTMDYDKCLELKKIEYKYDISFIGSKNPAREWIVEGLKMKGIMVHCFGSGWENGRVDFEEMRSIFYRSKINLNLSNSVPNNISFLKYVFANLLTSFKQIFKVSFRQYVRNIKNQLRQIMFFFYGNKTSEQVKARNFEICGWGGFQLSQYALELEDYYDIGSEIAIFTTLDELANQCRYYLENENIREQICRRGHQRTNEYTYPARLREIVDYLKGINGKSSEN